MKIRIVVEIEDNEGQIVDRVVRAIESLTHPVELPNPGPRRLEDIPPAYNWAPRRIRIVRGDDGA